MSAAAPAAVRYLRRRLAARTATDGELVRRFAARRDEDAFAELVDRHGPMVLGVARRAAGDHQAAEDVAQATFLTLARRAGQLRRPDAVPGWLHRTAYYLGRKAARARVRRERAEHNAPVRPPAGPPDLAAGELLAALDAELARLPDRFRLPLVLCCLEGLSQDEAAARLGWTAGSVRGRLQRGRRRLQAGLAKRGLAFSAGVGAALLLLPSTVDAGPLRAAAMRFTRGEGARPEVAALAASGPGPAWVAGVAVVTAAAVVVGFTLFPKVPAPPGASTPPGPVAERPGERAPDEPPLPAGAIKRLGDTRLRPGVRITCLAFSPDGSRVASVGNWLYFQDRLSVWDTATGREVFTQPIPEGTVAGLGWGPDGGLALRAGGDLWVFADAAGKHPPVEPAPAGSGPGRVVAVPAGAVPQVPARRALSADGTRLAAVKSGGGAVELFATKPGAAVADLKPLASTDKVPTGGSIGLFVVRGGKAVVAVMTGAKEHQAVVWDVEKGTVSDPVDVPVAVAQGDRYTVDAADDGSVLAVGLADGTVKVIELPSGKVRVSVRKHDGPAHGGKWSEVSAVKFVNGGRQVLSAGRDNQQIVWDAKTGANVAVLNGHKSWVEAVAVSADGKRVATAGQDSLVRLWDAATWKPILPPEGPHETVWRVEGSRDGKYVAAESGSGVYAWDLATGKLVRSLPLAIHGRKSGSILFAPDGSLLAADGKDGLAAYPMPVGEPKPVKPIGRLLDVSPDGKTLLTADGNTLIIWDWPAGAKRRAVPLKAEVLSAAVSPDGRAAVVGLSGKTTALVDLESGSAGDVPMTLHWFAHAAGFAAGGRVVCGTVGKPRAESWGVGTRALVKQFAEPPRNSGGHFYQLSFAVGPDGRKATNCHSDGGVTVYEVATGEVLAHFAGHRESAIGVAWAGPDRVLSGGGDHQTYVWDASLRAVGGKADAIPTADRPAAWDRLGTLPAKEAWKLMATLAADPGGTTALFAEKLKPFPAVDPAALDRIFKDLDAPAFATREKASRELAGLGPGAVGGVRERAAKSTSEEVRKRAEAFLGKYVGEDLSPERVRLLRALEVLSAIDTPAARRLIAALAGGAADVWETEAARQALRAQPAK